MRAIPCHFLMITALLFLSFLASAEPSSFDLQQMPLSQLVSLYFKEIHPQPYVLCDTVLKDQRLVSLRASGKSLDVAMLRAVLALHGYEARQQQGVMMVAVKSTPVTQPGAVPLEVPFVYRPQYRDVAYLVGLLTPMVQGTFANQAVSAPALAVGGGSSVNGGPSQSVTPTYQPRDDESLIFAGTPAQVKRLQGLLKQLDVPEASVLVKAVLYEVKKDRSSGSALKLVADVLKGQVGLSVGGDSLLNSLSIKAPNFDCVASVISSDGRFKVVTSPFARVKNHQSVRLQVGQDVPVSGQILLNPNGQSTQSTEYHSSGVILNVVAHIRGQVVDLDVVQTVSNFVKTTTGNTNNPTMNKREIQTAISLANGEMVLLGGLLDQQNEEANHGFFGYNFSKSKADLSSELLLLIQAERI